tara:strand:- start:42 stop:716 length:675 start_codon:yes stop_codon:yes gene_type:complete
MQTSDGVNSLRNGVIKFGDALSAVAYAHGITYEQLEERFPLVAKNNRYEGADYTIQEQLDFITEHKTRTPKNVLEIGAGRGEVTVFLSALGVQTTAIEPGTDASELFRISSHKLFPDQDIRAYSLINLPLHDACVDYTEYDTILMVESLEHILAEHFDPEWEKINKTFNGLFIVTNWKRYHPIAVGQYAKPEIHCRLVDNDLYDKFNGEHETIIRDKSHLCIKI